MLAAYYSRGCDSAELFGGFQIEAESGKVTNIWSGRY